MLGWPQFNWLPRPLWVRWRDLTWCRRSRRAWLKRLQHLYARGGAAQAAAIDRVECLAFKNTCWEFDDNVPIEWALVLVKRWNLKQWHIWHENRRGFCLSCGKLLEQYDTKWIETSSPFRLKCTDCRPDQDWSNYVDDAGDWYHWTDG